MKNESTEKIRARILTLIESEFESDAAFERAVGIPNKTVNNWRRGRSASFMRMLPELSARFKVNVGELMDMPLGRDTSELSDDELHMLHLYRRSRSMPEKMRHALRETIETTINLYISTYTEIKQKTKRQTRAKKSQDIKEN
ncbi:MAG: hypothetical protein IJY24_05735 [Clostridia bacterium]|nr:hypothetical protein [Clostridia bacterium]